MSSFYILLCFYYVAESLVSTSIDFVMFVRPFVHPSVHLYVRLFVCPSVYLSVRPSIRLSIRLYVSLITRYPMLVKFIMQVIIVKGKTSVDFQALGETPRLKVKFKSQENKNGGQKSKFHA